MGKNAESIAVLGAGSWGTALANHLARNNQTAYLWDRDAKNLELIKKTRKNDYYLPGISLSENIIPEADLGKILSLTQEILMVIPSHGFRAVLEELKKISPKPARIIWATKGLDPNKHQLFHEVVLEVLGDIPMAVLSGPNFAKEVAKGLPTAVTIATQDKKFASDLTTRFHSKFFRVYTSEDIPGVEIGGAMKNVLAIAVGISDGLGFGANARSALMTRGLAEMVRLGLTLGADRETFMGLSGLGDLILTCTDNQSRNRRFGLALGAGKNAKEAEQEIGQVVEGIRTTEEIYHLAKLKKIDLPICEQVYQVLYKNLNSKDAVSNLLSREAKTERISP